MTFRVIISAFAFALFLLGMGGVHADRTTDRPVVAEAAAFSVPQVADFNANSIGDPLGLLSSADEAPDSDNETEDLFPVRTVMRDVDRTMRPARAIRHRWQPHNAGAPPVPPPEHGAANKWTPSAETLLDATTSALGTVGGPDGKSSPKPASSTDLPSSFLPSASSIRSAATRDADRRRFTPAEHLVLLKSDPSSRRLAHALACASEHPWPFRARRSVRIGTPIPMKSDQWGTS